MSLHPLVQLLRSASFWAGAGLAAAALFILPGYWTPSFLALDLVIDPAGLLPQRDPQHPGTAQAPAAKPAGCAR